MEEIDLSYKFVCHNCHEARMEFSPNGWTCRSCGHEVADPPFKKGDWKEENQNDVETKSSVIGHSQNRSQNQ